MSLRVTVWHEYRHEKKSPEVAKIYPEGMHVALAKPLREAGFDVRTATLDEPQHGLTDEVLNTTDVLTWWGHMAHGEVSDEIVAKVKQRVLTGMGLVVLHSGHFSKIFKALMGTTCDLKWRETGDKEIMWVAAPGHPIVEGINDHIVIPHEEMYGEHFDIPQPDETILISSFNPGGEVFRSGVTFRRGMGRIFYFRPGHESYPTYYQPEVLKIFVNGVKWCAPTTGVTNTVYGKYESIL